MILQKFVHKLKMPKYKTSFKLPQIKLPYFPHYFRKIPATTLPHFVFYLIVLSLITLNAYHTNIFGFTTHTKLRYYLLENPFDPLSHTRLADYYLSQSELPLAEKEYTLSQNLYLSKQVLGITSASDSLSRIKNNKKIQEEEVNQWISINYQLPDYNFSYLKLASEYIKRGNNQQALWYLNQLLEKDPTNEIALKMKLLTK